ncbi:MAG: N-acetylmuramidase family protein [Lachnospiraceae bacterium]|nr:N-acetylmuramidase family protein [Lachnospiraceae bacterium]
MDLRHLLIAGTAAISVMAHANAPEEKNLCDSLISVPDSINTEEHPHDTATIIRLTEEDYRRAAEELGVEVAAIKAVVLIEAGHKLNGFHAPRVPLINFDLTMFTKAATRRGIKLNKFKKTHPVVFARPDKKRYGSYQEAQHARLTSAMTIDSIAAIEGTFWGMFQIGGFNWKKCGAESHTDFVDRMSRSESEQLELFVKFILTNKLEKYLKKKDWASFARIYNGPSYKKRNYHKRMAAAYRKFSKE